MPKTLSKCALSSTAGGMPSASLWGDAAPLLWLAALGAMYRITLVRLWYALATLIPAKSAAIPPEACSRSTWASNLNLGPFFRVLVVKVDH